MKYSSDEIIEQFNLVHSNKYDYSLVKYINDSCKIDIICPIHGIFEQKVNNHLNGKGCKKCKSSKGEKIINNFLTDNCINFIKQKTFNNLKYKKPLKIRFLFTK